jgi:hypothetical protein
MDNSDEYWSVAQVASVGLIAWRVDAKYNDNPTAILRPMLKAWYPETYIQVFWQDGGNSWESRGNFRHIYCMTDLEADILIYRMAIHQQSEYEFALTGQYPTLPDGGNMQNLHWRNTNADGKAHWLTPRARSETADNSFNEERSNRYSGRAHSRHRGHTEADVGEQGTEQSSAESDEGFHEESQYNNHDHEIGHPIDSSHSESGSDSDDDDDDTHQTPRHHSRSSGSRSRSRSHSQSYQAGLMQDTPTPLFTPANRPRDRRHLSPIDEDFITPQSRPQPPRHQTPTSSRSHTPKSIFSQSRNGESTGTSVEPDRGSSQRSSRESSQATARLNTHSRRQEKGSRSLQSKKSIRSEGPTPRPHTEPRPRKNQQQNGLNSEPSWSLKPTKPTLNIDKLSDSTPGPSRSGSTPSSSGSKNKDKDNSRSGSIFSSSGSKGREKDNSQEHSTSKGTPGFFKGKEVTKDTSSISQRQGQEDSRSDGTPGSSRSKGKERGDGKRREDFVSDGTPGSSRSKGKEREDGKRREDTVSDGTPGSSRSKGKERGDGKRREDTVSDGTPGSSKSKGKQPESGSKPKKRTGKGKKYVGAYRRPNTRSKVEFDV